MRKSHIIWILALVIISGGGYFWFSQHSNGEDAKQGQDPAAAMAMMAPEVSVITLHNQPVTLSKDLPGRTSAVRVAEIRPQVSGIITKRLFTEGTDVKMGQQLYQIDPAPYQAAFESARADLMKAQANIKSVQAKSDRYSELVKIGGISKQDYDDIVASLEQSKANIAIAQAAVRTARINLDYTKVLSPIAGRIGKSVVTEGALVTANQPDVLALVQQFDKIYVDVVQSSDELMRLRQQFMQSGSKKVKPTARLVIGGEEYGEEGVFQFSDATVNQTTGTVQLRILFPNTERLVLPGLFVHARLSVASDKIALTVPQKATTRNADGSVSVWIVDDNNNAAMRPIKVNDAVGDQWIVEEGLSEGERVIVEGIMKVKPGSPVRPVDFQAKSQEQQPEQQIEQQQPDIDVSESDDVDAVEDQATALPPSASAEALPSDESAAQAETATEAIAPIETQFEAVEPVSAPANKAETAE
jgi:membrane fusion protein (multidrug efflux system)